MRRECTWAMAVGFACASTCDTNALPHNHCTPGVVVDEQGNETITVCGSVSDPPGMGGGLGWSGGTPQRGGEAIRPPSERRGGESVRPGRSQGGSSSAPLAPAPAQTRPMGPQPAACAVCQTTYQQELTLSRVTYEACKSTGEAVATAQCEREHVNPDGSHVDGYRCSNDGTGYRCRGPGIERCKRLYKTGMPGSSDSTGLSINFQVPISATATRTVTLNYAPVAGYFSSCSSTRMGLRTQAETNRVMCGRRIAAERRGVCTF